MAPKHPFTGLRFKLHFKLQGIACIIVGLAAVQAAQATPNYAITDLGTLGGSTSFATAINNSGQVAGYALLSGDQHDHAFRSSASASANGKKPKLTDLGTLGGDASGGYGINAAGQVAGFSYLRSGDQAYHAFRSTANGKKLKLTDLLTLGGALSYAFGINGSGQVAGWSIPAGGVLFQRAFRSSTNGQPVRLTDLGTLGGSSSSANGINDSGQVTGWASLNGDQSAHAFRSSANGKKLKLTDLGTLGGDSSFGIAINAGGQVAGISYLPGNQVEHAFRSTANGKVLKLTDLGALGNDPYSYAAGINDRGLVVGWSSQGVKDTINQRAFLFDGAIHDLNSLIPSNSGWIVKAAHGINHRGQIAATGENPGLGITAHALLLTPLTH